MEKRRIVLQFIGCWRCLRVHLQTNIQRSTGYLQSSTRINIVLDIHNRLRLTTSGDTEGVYWPLWD